MLIQKDYWMMKEPRQKGVYRGDIAERLEVHPGTVSQQSTLGRLARLCQPRTRQNPTNTPSGGALCLRLEGWVFVRWSLGAVVTIVHIVARNCHLLPPWYREDKELDTMESRFGMQRMRFRPLAPTLSQQEGGMP